MADKKTKKDALTVEKSMADFERAYRAKKDLIEREKEDHLFALGDQWKKEDLQKLEAAGMKPITDNRIAPNIFLLTGLERQNRTDFKAFPTGAEDTVKAEIATILFKDSIKVSGFAYESSDQFKDGITCGESHLELYLDYTDNILNGKPCWVKLDGDVVFPEPGFRKYDFSDCRYIYKIKLDVSKEDLINLFPDSEKLIEEAGSGRLDYGAILGTDAAHQQKRDYPKSGDGSGWQGDAEDAGFDLIERYYKKWVKTFLIADKQTGTIEQAETEAKAKAFLANYKNQIVADQQAYEQALAQAQPQVDEFGQPMADPMGQPMQPMQAPPPPPERDPERFMLIKRLTPEIWCFAHVPGIDEPLSDKRAWYYPKWTTYGIVPYFARFSTAPVRGDKRHLLIQGVVTGVKGVQEKHNKAEMLMLRHLNTSANSGWLAQEESWVDESKVEQFGSTPGINLYYKKGFEKPERITPTPLSNGHAALAAESAEAIKAQLGINSDLLATQEASGDSGRAIALRQKQGLLMLQELFDNLSRTRYIAGKFILSQLGEIYDTETAKQVLGEAFLVKNFPPPMEFQADPMTGAPAIDPATGQPVQKPIVDPKTGQPMQYDTEMAELAIAEVLSGELGKYDVTIGEAVASETQKLANASEIKEIAAAYPGLIPPDILIEESQLPQSTKNRVLASLQQAQAMAQAGGGQPPPKAKDAAE